MPSPKADWITKVIRLFTKDEVKTPLSFLFKVVTYLVAALIVILYAPVEDNLKWNVVRIVFYGMFALSCGVLIFAWWRPKNLVYGETGHRGEHKLEFGTDAGIQTKEEIDVLTNESDPKQPRLEQD